MANVSFFAAIVNKGACIGFAFLVSISSTANELPAKVSIFPCG